MVASEAAQVVGRQAWEEHVLAVEGVRARDHRLDIAASSGRTSRSVPDGGFDRGDGDDDADRAEHVRRPAGSRRQRGGIARLDTRRDHAIAAEAARGLLDAPGGQPATEALPPHVMTDLEVLEMGGRAASGITDDDLVGEGRRHADEAIVGRRLGHDAEDRRVLGQERGDDVFAILGR